MGSYPLVFSFSYRTALNQSLLSDPLWVTFSVLSLFGHVLSIPGLAKYLLKFGIQVPGEARAV